MDEQSGTLFLGRQPIVNEKAGLIGYELLYRDQCGNSEIKNAQSATANVLTHTLSLSGIEKIIGEHRAFVNVDAKFLQHDMILSVPKERFVFELAADDEADETLFERLGKLNEAGYSFAVCIDDAKEQTLARVKEMIAYVDFVKFNTMEVSKERLLKLLLSLGANQKEFIATHVETKELYEAYLEMGFKLFQGYFFAKPELVSSSQVSADTASIINVCNLLSTDAPMKEITAAFSQTPKLVIQLIQYLNSCAFHFRESINSIERIITLLGRKTLIQWIFLTLYASSDGDNRSCAILQMIQQRTQLIVDLYKAVKPDASSSEVSQAYFVGLLSLLDVVLKQPLEMILESIQLDADIKEALLNKHGLLGEIYEVALAIEQFDLAKIEAFMLEHEISASSFEGFLFRSFQKAGTFALGS